MLVHQFGPEKLIMQRNMHTTGAASMTLSELKPNARAVLRAIAQQPPQTPAQMTIKEIAEAAGLSINTIRTHIRYLASSGYLSHERSSTGRPYQFVVSAQARIELMNSHE